MKFKIGTKQSIIFLFILSLISTVFVLAANSNINRFLKFYQFSARHPSLPKVMKTKIDDEKLIESKICQINRCIKANQFKGLDDIVTSEIKNNIKKNEKYYKVVMDRFASMTNYKNSQRANFTKRRTPNLKNIQNMPNWDFEMDITAINLNSESKKASVKCFVYNKMDQPDDSLGVKYKKHAKKKKIKLEFEKENNKWKITDLEELLIVFEERKNDILSEEDSGEL